MMIPRKGSTYPNCHFFSYTVRTVLFGELSPLKNIIILCTPDISWHSATALYMIEILWSQPSGDLLPNVIMQTYTTRHTICHLLLRHQKPFRVMMRRGAGSGPKLVTPDMGSLGGGIPSNPIENGHRNSGFTHWKRRICPSFFVCLPEGKESHRIP